MKAFHILIALVFFSSLTDHIQARHLHRHQKHLSHHDQEECLNAEEIKDVIKETLQGPIENAVENAYDKRDSQADEEDCKTEWHDDTQQENYQEETADEGGYITADELDAAVLKAIQNPEVAAAIAAGVNLGDCQGDNQQGNYEDGWENQNQGYQEGDQSGYGGDNYGNEQVYGGNEGASNTFGGEAVDQQGGSECEVPPQLQGVIDAINSSKDVEVYVIHVNSGESQNNNQQAFGSEQTTENESFGSYEGQTTENVPFDSCGGQTTGYVDSYNGQTTGNAPFGSYGSQPTGYNGQTTGYESFEGQTTGNVPFDSYGGQTTGYVDSYNGQTTGNAPLGSYEGQTTGYNDQTTGNTPVETYGSQTTGYESFGSYEGQTTGNVPFGSYGGQTTGYADSYTSQTTGNAPVGSYGDQTTGYVGSYGDQTTGCEPSGSYGGAVTSDFTPQAPFEAQQTQGEFQSSGFYEGDASNGYPQNTGEQSSQNQYVAPLGGEGTPGQTSFEGDEGCITAGLGDAVLKAIQDPEFIKAVAAEEVLQASEGNNQANSQSAPEASTASYQYQASVTVGEPALSGGEVVASQESVSISQSQEGNVSTQFGGTGGEGAQNQAWAPAQSFECVVPPHTGGTGGETGQTPQVVEQSSVTTYQEPAAEFQQSVTTAVAQEGQNQEVAVPQGPQEVSIDQASVTTYQEAVSGQGSGECVTPEQLKEAVVRAVQSPEVTAAIASYVDSTGQGSNVVAQQESVNVFSNQEQAPQSEFSAASGETGNEGAYQASSVTVEKIECVIPEGAGTETVQSAVTETTTTTVETPVPTEVAAAATQQVPAETVQSEVTETTTTTVETPAAEQAPEVNAETSAEAGIPAETVATETLPEEGTSQETTAGSTGEVVNAETTVTTTETQEVTGEVPVPAEEAGGTETGQNPETPADEEGDEETGEPSEGGQEESGAPAEGSFMEIFRGYKENLKDFLSPYTG